MKIKELCISIFLTAVLPLLVASLMTKPKQEQTMPQLQQTTSVTEETREYIRVLHNGAVVSLEFEEYICGVVLKEMPADFETEALKAQAVVARTYTRKRQQSADKHENAAICSDPSCCQGYWSCEEYIAAGGSWEAVEKIRMAVSATEGQVLLYHGKLIEAIYFSCSGGMTEDASAVWGAQIPYLQAKESPGEEGATHYSDTVHFFLEDFCGLIGQSVPATADGWIRDITYTQGNGVATITIGGDSYTGVQLRSLLGLRSTAFYITALGNTVTVTTKGFGHRVGMSQYGADAMAVSGYNYGEILSYYYTGTQLVNAH